jgi:hypothetical protein
VRSLGSLRGVEVARREPRVMLHRLAIGKTAVREVQIRAILAVPGVTPHPIAETI